MGIDDKGRGIIATGNPDTAKNVATFVPGTGSKLSGIGGDLGRSEAMRKAALKAGEPSTAVVTWYGYNAPPGLTDAMQDKYADAGAPDLDHFQDGLRGTHDGPRSHNVVVGTVTAPPSSVTPPSTDAASTPTTSSSWPAQAP